MQKHAFLILAHNEPEMLQTLVSLLDSRFNDIFIHWDAKSGPVPGIIVKESVLKFTTRRIRVYWGDYSVVEAEYELFSEARAEGSYQYYHLISGYDLPIKPLADMRRECEENPGIEYIGFADATESEIAWRVNHFFLFPHSFKSGNPLVRLIRKVSNAIQDVLRLRHPEGVFKKGSQWVSVTQEFVDYLLSQREYAASAFRRTYCPDELFVQTLCWNSRFRSKVFCLNDEFNGCRRYIKWENGDLKPITSEDVPAMLSSGRWFARKFDPNDRQTINTIVSCLKRDL